MARRALPSAVRYRLRGWMFRWLDLTWSTRTGVRLRVEHYGEWVIYNEIFVNREYDQAIDLALAAATPGAALQVLDLGAHIGFFTLRTIDRLRERAPEMGVAITAIEASNQLAHQFRTRVVDDNQLGREVRLVTGLAGARSGSATYFADAASLRTGNAGTEVPYVDLSSLLSSVSRIDLLKCDIEGSEQPVIENYRDLFDKVQVAVFEMHRNLCDTERCKRLLAEYGFTHSATFRDGDPYFTYGVWR
jgi:FkbM family methyltransferase